MNKVRTIGLVILAIGVILIFTIENSTTDFISGVLIGLGFGLLIIGKIGRPTT